MVENNSLPFDIRVWNEARSMAEQGYRVLAICPTGHKSTKLYEVIKDIEIYRYTLLSYGDGVLGYIKEYIHCLVNMWWLTFKVYFFKVKFHAIHAANPPDILWTVAIWYKIFGVKFVFDEHDPAPDTFLSKFGDKVSKKSIFYIVQKKLQLMSYWLADRIINVNNTYSSIAIESTGYPPKKFSVVRNGPRLEEFHSVPQNPKWKFGFTHMVAYMGIMATQDNVDVVLRACNYFVHTLKREDVCFVLMGDGDDKPRLEELVKEFQIEKNVRFLGMVYEKETILEVLSTADLCLSPEQLNPLNNHASFIKIMEYMACRKPIIAFDLHETRYSADEAALYIKNNDIDAFGQAITSLIEDKETATSMGEAGWKRVQDKLSWQRQGEILNEMYEDLFKR